MDILSFIIIPLSGAVIGYFTNWLAVKMLFRPYEEKRILGLRVPMTPGLIPKERLRLSEKIGETLAANILTEEELKKAVTSPEVMEKLGAILDKFLEEVRSGKYDDQIENLCCIAADKIVEFIDLPDSPVSRLAATLYENFKGFLLTAGKDYLTSLGMLNDFDRLVKTFADKLYTNDSKISQYVPGRLAEAAKQFVTRRMPEAVEFLKGLPERFPDIDEKLNELVFKIAQDNFGSFLGIFLHYDQLYGKIKKSLFEYLETPENQAFLSEKIIALLDGLLEKEVGEVAKKIPESAVEDVVDRLDGLIQKAVEHEIPEKIFGSAEARLRQVNLSQALKKLAPNLSDAIKKILMGVLNSLIGNLNDERAVSLREFIINALTVVVEKGGAYVVGSLQFDKIVENKINDFSTKEMEDLVVSVVDKELKAITWLGGVLGLVIGFVPLILQAVGIG